MERTSLKSLVVTWLILFLVGCASSPSVKLNARGQSELQVAILNDDVNTALRIIENGSIFDVMYVGWEPTAPALALAHDDPRMIESMVRRFGPEHMFLNWSWVEYQEAACEYFARLDASPTLRPLLREMARPEEACPKQDTTFAALVRRNVASLSEETLTWALGDGYQQQLLFALKADPQSAIPMLAEQSPEELGFSNQDALVAAQIGGHRAAIERIIEYGADPDLIGSEQWGEILCESLEIGSHEQDVLIEQMKAHAQRSGPCGAYWYTALWDDRMTFFDATLTAGLYESNELESILETAEFKKNVPAMAIIAKHFGLSSLTPSAQKTILDSSEGKKVLYDSLDDDAKHEFACRLLAIPRSLDSVEREMVEESVVLARRCEGGQLPIMAASAVPENFEFVYNLDPSVYRRQVTKTEVLRAALDTGKPELIEKVADRSGNLLASLEASDLRGVIDQPELLRKLESRGLPTKHRAYADLAGRCEAIKNKEYIGLINQTFFTNFGPPLANAAQTDQDRKVALAAYRDCLDKRAAQIKSSNLFRTSEDEPPEVSEDIYAYAKARALYALSLIAARNSKDQDPVRAREMIYQGYDSIRANVDSFKKEANDYASLQREKLQLAQEEAFRRREKGHEEVDSATWKGLGITALVGGIMVYNDLDASEVVEMGVKTTLEWSKAQTQKIERDFYASINAIETTEIVLPEIEDARTTYLDNDGVRLLVPRYGSNSPYGSLNVDASYDHTHAVVRLKASNGGFCTGAVLSGQRILTAQHCVVDDELKMLKGIQATNDFFSAASGTLMYVREAYSGPWKYTTAEKRYTDSKNSGVRYTQNDWAILEPVNKSDPNIPDFLKQSYLEMLHENEVDRYLQKRGKLAVSGYAAHLNNGVYLTMHWGCSPTAVSPLVFEYNCLGFGGDSGAPVIVTEGKGKGRVIGVHSYGRYGDGDREAGIPSNVGGNVSVANIQRELKAGRFITGVIE